MVCIQDILHDGCSFGLQSIYTSIMYEIRTVLGNKDTNMVEIMIKLATSV